MMIPDRPSEKVTIEDLLRVKRAERPSPEFWARFERDLRAKQLAAIVEKRPWWHALHLPQAARVVARFQVPLGSAAVLALSFVVVSQYQGRAPINSVAVPSAPDVSAPATQVAVVAPRVEQVRASVNETVTEVRPVAEAAASVVRTEAKAAPVAVAANASVPAAQPAELTSMIPWGAGQVDADDSVAQSPLSTRLLQAGLQVASTSDLNVTPLLGNALVQDGPLQSTRASVAEAKPAVVQAVSPRELRRAKILAGLVLAANDDGAVYARAVHGRDVAANDLSEDQLYDSARRLGVGGDRFTLKF